MLGVAAVSKKVDMNMKDVFWVLAVGSQVGLSIALPVIAGLAVGYWIDTRLLGSLPWITLLLTLIGTAIGPFITYRWVISSVQRRLEKKDQEES
jgi:F0F1-type ATP synthase assembly protein I